MGQINHVEGEDHAPEVREPGGYRHSDADIGRDCANALPTMSASIRAASRSRSGTAR